MELTSNQTEMNIQLALATQYSEEKKLRHHDLGARALVVGTSWVAARGSQVTGWWHRTMVMDRFIDSAMRCAVFPMQHPPAICNRAKTSCWMEAHSLLLLDGSSSPLSQKYSRSSGAFHNTASTTLSRGPPSKRCCKFYGEAHATIACHKCFLTCHI